MAERPKDPSPRPRRANLADQIIESLRDKLLAGDLRPGDRLPTEKALSNTHGVSRAVVREAIAVLRADGLVVARQGSGAYAAERPTETQRHTLFPFDPEKLSSMIEVLELRAAVESEAAALAAERAAPAGLARITECHRDFGAAIAEGGDAEQQDVALHLAIASATHNSQFVAFFQFLGSRTIPRAQVRQQPRADAGGFLRRIDHEHAAIVHAITQRDPAGARTAMIAHLKGSQDRYSRLLDTAQAALHQT